MASEASRAIYFVNGHKFDGKRLKVEYAQRGTNKFVSERMEKIEYYKRTGRCFRCQQRGHISKECPQKQFDRERGDGRESKRSSSRYAKKSQEKEGNRDRDAGKSTKDSKSSARSSKRKKSRSRSRSTRKKREKRSKRK